MQFDEERPNFAQ